MKRMYGAKAAKELGPDIKVGCDPPTKKPKKTPRFLIRAGTIIRTRKASATEWMEHVTKQDLGFDRFETYRAIEQEYQFRQGAYLIQVWRGHVKHREDEPGYGRR